MLNIAVGFLGAGKMAEALARGILGRKLLPPERILMSDVDDDRRAYMANALKVRLFDENAAVVRQSDLVVIALKPNDLRRALPEVAAEVTGSKLVVSIAAGVTLAELEGLLPSGSRVVRVMPNTPCLVGSGAAGISLGSSAREEDGDLVGQIMSAVGICFLLPERLLDAVTGLSGSGPAFVAVIIEALADGGVLCGLPRDVAVKLAAQTLLGTARLIAETDRHPAQVKDMVASPGGTTIEGLKVLEGAGIRGALIQAVEAAARKSMELGRR